jgi:hypothetical protein
MTRPTPAQGQETMMHTAPKFAEFRNWLASPEYAAQMAKLIGEPKAPARTDWPVDIAALVAQHEAHATMCLEGAARHMRMANELALTPTQPPNPTEGDDK